MAYFWDQYPDTNFHEINLDWFLKVAQYVKETADTMNEWKKTHEKEYRDLKQLVDSIEDWIEDIESGDIPEALINGLATWIDNNVQQLIGKNMRYVWFGLTDEGYFVAYMPESWKELWFDTVMDYSNEYYGHLLIKYDAQGLQEATPYYSTDRWLNRDQFWSREDLIPFPLT